MLRSLAATSRPHHYICVIVICSIFKIKKNSQKNRNDCRQLVVCFHGRSVHKRHSTNFRLRLVSVNHCTGYCQPFFDGNHCYMDLNLNYLFRPFAWICESRITFFRFKITNNYWLIIFNYTISSMANDCN